MRQLGCCIPDLDWALVFRSVITSLWQVHAIFNSSWPRPKRHQEQKTKICGREGDQCFPRHTISGFSASHRRDNQSFAVPASKARRVTFFVHNCLLEPHRLVKVTSVFANEFVTVRHITSHDLIMAFLRQAQNRGPGRQMLLLGFRPPPQLRSQLTPGRPFP